MRAADPRLADYAYAVQQRWPWAGSDTVVVGGREVKAQTVVVEVLRAADQVGFLRDSVAALDASAVDVEAAARLLARYSHRYDDRPHGRGWEAVLDSVEHAYTKATEQARSTKVRDQIDAAYGVLRREVERRSSRAVEA